jgi:hypothetical protein
MYTKYYLVFLFCNIIFHRILKKKSFIRSIITNDNGVCYKLKSLKIKNIIIMKMIFKIFNFYSFKYNLPKSYHNSLYLKKKLKTKKPY